MKQIALISLVFSLLAFDGAAQGTEAKALYSPPPADYLEELFFPGVSYFQKAIGKPKGEIVKKFNVRAKFKEGYRMLTWEEMIKSGDADTKTKGWNLIFVDANNHITPKVTVLFKAPSYMECSGIGWTVPQDDYEAINGIVRQLSFSGYVVVNKDYLPDGDLLVTYENAQGFMVSLMEISHRSLISFTMERRER